MQDKDLKHVSADGVGSAVQSLEQIRSLSRERFSEIIQAALRIGLLTLLLFGAFFLPFMIGMEITQMKSETSQMRVEMMTMDKQIQEYNLKIAAYGDLLQFSQSKAEKGNQ